MIWKMENKANLNYVIVVYRFFFCSINGAQFANWKLEEKTEMLFFIRKYGILKVGVRHFHAKYLGTLQKYTILFVKLGEIRGIKNKI